MNTSRSGKNVPHSMKPMPKSEKMDMSKMMQKKKMPTDPDRDEMMKK